MLSCGCNVTQISTICVHERLDEPMLGSARRTVEMGCFERSEETFFIRESLEIDERGTYPHE